MTAPTLVDPDLDSIVAKYDLAKLSRQLAGRRALVIGAGDLARKKLHWIKFLKRIGVDVYLADTREKPTALDTLSPYINEFLSIADKKAERHLIELGRKKPFYIVDISTWADSHLALALRLQDSAQWIVDTKPVDTNLDLLRTIQKYVAADDPIFRRLVEKLLIHDHYGGRWVVREAEELMPQWHHKNGFITEVQIYILEHQSVNHEKKRIDAIRDGMCLDLMPHAFRVLESLMPIGLSWEVEGLRYTRRDVKLTMGGGAREQNIGCVIPGRVETFAAVNLEGVDVVEINGEFGRTESFPFRCLVVVGKGVSANEGDERDTKGVSVVFQTGNRVSLDLESQRIQCPDGSIVLPPADVLHRGINWPLIELTVAGPSQELDPRARAFFQAMAAACRGMELITSARQLPWLGNAYPERYGCVDLVNKVPRNLWGREAWQLQHLPQIQIGQPPRDALVVP